MLTFIQPVLQAKQENVQLHRAANALLPLNSELMTLNSRLKLEHGYRRSVSQLALTFTFFSFRRNCEEVFKQQINNYPNKSRECNYIVSLRTCFAMIPKGPHHKMRV